MTKQSPESMTTPQIVRTTLEKIRSMTPSQKEELSRRLFQAYMSSGGTTSPAETAQTRQTLRALSKARETELQALIDEVGEERAIEVLRELGKAARAMRGGE